MSGIGDKTVLPGFDCYVQYLDVLTAYSNDTSLTPKFLNDARFKRLRTSVGHRVPRSVSGGWARQRPDLGKDWPVRYLDSWQVSG